MVEKAETGESLKTLRQLGGYCGSAKNFGLIEVYGKDAARFLQSQTTNDVLALNQSSGQETSLLDRKAKIVACFDLYRRHESFRLIADNAQVQTILDHLEHFRIADKVEFLDLTDTGQFFLLQGPRCRSVLASGLHSQGNPGLFKHDVLDLKLWDVSVHVFRKSITGEDGYFLWVPKSEVEQFSKSFQSAAQKLGLVELTNAVLETARVEAGVLKFGADFNEQNFLPETGLDQAVVSYTKGCFLGQEVLARVRSQGAPTRGLVGLSFPPGKVESLKANESVLLDNEEIGTLKSFTYSPTLSRTVAIASVKRDYRTPGKSYDLTISGAPYKVEVSLLPFYQAQPLRVKARELYEESLQHYAKEQDDAAQSEAVNLLREALEMDPLLEDAYEALGVILSKRHQLDEAIALMTQLTELNPDSVMAHTNLSVFYLEKGWKERAEDEKAISVSIRMRLATSDITTKKDEATKKEQEIQDAKERMEMFKQVLEIDADDLLANYGMGSCLVVLAEFQQALPFLQKAIEIKSSYTVAYVSMGQAYEGLRNVPEAMKVYEQGIEVAAKRGDMTPLSQMQQRLTALKDAKQSELV